jgi:soluble lytic murein transglycosylase-like protein
VKRFIRYWKSTNRFENAIRHAQSNGYVQVIVETFQRYGLPPEFFYLGLQESNFEARIVGPWTRYGHAKGMWQFIPETGRRYGLTTGPLVDQGVYDPQDERHDYVRAADASAHYLLDIYTELAEASGLLAMASYNWGEGRVIPRLPRLEGLSDEQQADPFAGIPQNPQQRSYWRFLNEYGDRMPQQTKDYVFYIVSAAVIGQNPRLFGFDFDNPLEPYMARAAVAAPSEADSMEREAPTVDNETEPMVVEPEPIESDDEPIETER